MSLFELRQWFESLFPWWAPFIIPISGLCIYFIYSFLQGLQILIKIKKDLEKKRAKSLKRI